MRRRDSLGKVVLVCGVGLLLCGSTQSAATGAESYKNGNDIQKAIQSNPRDAAMVDFIARRLPGNDSIWYVVVLRAKGSDVKGMQVIRTCGKTAAAFEIAKFLQSHPKIMANPMAYSRWLYVETYPDEKRATMRCIGICSYARQSGYR